jgi:hypothetical protein
MASGSNQSLSTIIGTNGSLLQRSRAAELPRTFLPLSRAVTLHFFGRAAPFKGAAFLFHGGKFTTDQRIEPHLCSLLLKNPCSSVVGAIRLSLFLSSCVLVVETLLPFRAFRDHVPRPQFAPAKVVPWGIYLVAGLGSHTGFKH